MEDELICRTCLRKDLRQNCKNISPGKDNDETCHILEMLSYCVPELDIYMVNNPVICSKCFCLLETAFEFKSECLKIEEKLLEYCHSVNSKIDLNYFDKNSSVFNNNAHLVNNDELQGIEVITIRRTNLMVNEDGHQSSNCTAEVNVANDNYIPRFDCEKCGGCTNKLEDPSYHSKVYASPYICHNCGKEMENLMGFRKHMMKHRKQRKCKVCNKLFRDLHQLTIHLRTHTGAKPFTCNLCPKSFRQKHNLDQHLRQHKGDSTVKCGICEKVFSTKYNVKVHVQNAHVKKPTCELCGKKFYTKKALIKHLESPLDICGNIKTEICLEPSDEIMIKKESEYTFSSDQIQELLKEEHSENEDSKFVIPTCDQLS